MEGASSVSTLKTDIMFLYSNKLFFSATKTNLHVLGFECVQLFLHLADVAGGLGHFGPLQVALGQELFDVLLLFFQSLLQCGGAGDLACVT